MHQAYDAALILGVLLRPEDDAARAAESVGLPADAVAAWRAAVVDAALAVLDTSVAPVGWVQVDLALGGTAASCAGVLAGPVADHLTEWTATGQATNAWFLHKPPGVRLRLEGDRRELRSLLAPVLDGLVATGALSGWRFGAYLPEAHLFGGSVGMGLAHRFFTADSLAVLAYERARLERTASLVPAELSFLLLDGCLARLVPDPWERWDVWCRLRWTGRVLDQARTAGSVSSELAGDAVAWVRAVRSFPGPWAGASRAEQVILDDYQRRIEALAESVAEVVRDGDLPVNLRQVLPFWIVFHWNRLSFTLEAQRALTRVVVAALDPRGPAVE